MLCQMTRGQQSVRSIHYYAHTAKTPLVQIPAHRIRSKIYDPEQRD